MVESSKATQPETGATEAPRHRRRTDDFFVVGGPVAPERPCYIERSTDGELLELLRAGSYCHVVSPRFSGKSSLAARAAMALRGEGNLAAVIDLSQLGARDGVAEVGRWYYGLAYRVLRGLRLKFDLQAWWQERRPLPPPQRLAEFFWEVVLGATRANVVVFLDEIEWLEDSDLAAELFGIVRACHDARAGEPEYRRLSFVLLGASMPTGKAAPAAVAATEIGPRLVLPDFSFQQARAFARGMGLPEGDAERALYRVLYWTGGHPYLTQKLCQAVARNAARIESDQAVDRLVAARFFARKGTATETSISCVLDGLDRAGKLARPALRLYRRIHRGRRLRYEADDPTHELLRVCGLVNITAKGRLAVRNRIYAEVFSHRWMRDALPIEWGRLGRAAAVTGLVLGGLWAYVEVLPRPYEETLKVASVELDEADTAWAGLRRLPGFSGRADRLLARVLSRASRSAEAWPEVEALDVRLRQLRGFDAQADALLVDYWERRAAGAEAAEQRDAALLYRLRAYEAGPTADAGLAAMLGGADYQRLVTLARPAGLIESVAMAPGGRDLVTISAGNLVERWDAESGRPAFSSPLELLAEEFVTVRRRLSLDTPGRVSAARLELMLDHPRPGDLHLVLVAPSGRSVTLQVSQAEPEGDRLVLDEARAPVLRELRGEQALGTWALEIEDRESGETGMFGGWSLALSDEPGHRAEDRPENPLLLPAPTRSSAVRAALSPDGATVAAVPRNPGAGGRLHTWDAASGGLLASFEVRASERWLGFADERTLLLLEDFGGVETLRIVDARDGEDRLAHVAEPRFESGPALSPDRQFIALAEAGTRQAWIRDLESGRVVFRQPAAGGATAVAVAPGGLQLALADSSGVVRVWHATDGAIAVEFSLPTPAAALAFDPSGRWLVTVEAGGRLNTWDLLSPEAAPVLSRPHVDPRQFAFDDTGRRLAVLGPAEGYEVWSLPDGTPLGPVLRHEGSRRGLPGPADRLAGSQAMLFGDQRLLGGRGTRTVSIWHIDPEARPMDLPRIPSIVGFAPSGLRAGAGTPDGRVVLRRRNPESMTLEFATITRPEARHGGGVSSLAFSPDGRRLASLGGDGTVILWDAATGRRAGEIFQHGSGRVEAARLGPDGRSLVTGGELGARSWDAESGVPGPMLGASRAVSAVAVDAGGRRAFTGTSAGELESWDLGSGERLWFASMEAPVGQLCVSEDGLRIAAASETGLVQAWGMVSGGRPLNLALSAPVIGLQFSPDGNFLLAQTPGWLHRLGVTEGRLRVLASRLLPAAVPPGAWRSANTDGTRVVLIGGAQGESMTALDFVRTSLPPEDWVPAREAWHERLKLYFDGDGELQYGVADAAPIM